MTITSRTPTDDTNIQGSRELPPPSRYFEQIPRTDDLRSFVYDSRQTIKNIQDGKDGRLCLILGPCSVHNPEETIELAKEIKPLADEVKDKVFVVMRLYPEKPRTTTGWKGLLRDPGMDETFRIEDGIGLTRKLFRDVNAIGLPVATEFVDTQMPQYLADLVSWAAIGARTTEAQTHRELASGLSMPVGFKNGTTGDIQVAINAIIAARKPDMFVGVNQMGHLAVENTKGNNYTHLVLRGGAAGPNYDSVRVKSAYEAMKKAGITNPGIIIDCSHDNTLDPVAKKKDYRLQPMVFRSAIRAIADYSNGDRSPVFGMMLESNLYEGAQPLVKGAKPKPGISVTDACIDMPTTRELVRYAHKNLKK